MTRQYLQRWISGIAVGLLFGWPLPLSAQTFSSGSTGVDGAFAPTANTAVVLPPDGVLNFTTVNIPAGVTVLFTPNAANTPVTILATGDVTIAGTIGLNGGAGTPSSATGPTLNVGGAAVHGGFPGGNGGARGGGAGPSAGQGIGGGVIGNSTNFRLTNGTYGASTAFVLLLPLFGGSGGGGGAAFLQSGTSFSGASGGGGGAAMVIASSTRITVTGLITANGGAREIAFALSCPASVRLAGAGSGGAIRLVAPEVTGSGTLETKGGVQCTDQNGNPTVLAGAGRIRLEAFTLGFTGTVNPAPSSSLAPGPVTAAGDPALINLPTLAISAVGGIAAPGTPGGSYTTADVSLPQGTTNPVSVSLTAANIPVGTVFTVKLIPQTGDAAPTSSTPSTGTFATSTATANVNFPTGEVSVLNAFGSFTLPTQVASLYPLIDGEPVDRVIVAAAYGEPSTVTLITKSGKAVPADDVFRSVM